MKTFWKFFFLQALAYGLCDCSARFVAQGQIPLSVTSGMIYAWVAFRIIRRVGEAAEPSAIWGYILGGGLGTALGIVASKHVTGI